MVLRNLKEDILDNSSIMPFLCKKFLKIILLNMILYLYFSIFSNNIIICHPEKKTFLESPCKYCLLLFQLKHSIWPSIWTRTLNVCNLIFFNFFFFIVDVLAKFELTIQRILKLVIVLIQWLFILLIHVIYLRSIQQIFPEQNRPQPYQRLLHQQNPCQPRRCQHPPTGQYPPCQHPRRSTRQRNAPIRLNL